MRWWKGGKERRHKKQKEKKDIQSLVVGTPELVLVVWFVGGGLVHVGAHVRRQFSQCFDTGLYLVPRCGMAGWV
jgi:hypothetical protein